MMSTSTTISSSVRTVAEWTPKTYAGRIVKRDDVTRLKEPKKLKLEVREPEIIDTLFLDLVEDVIKVTKNGQRQYQLKAFVIVGDGRGLIGLGMGCGVNDQ